MADGPVSVATAVLMDFAVMAGLTLPLLALPVSVFGAACLQGLRTAANEMRGRTRGQLFGIAGRGEVVGGLGAVIGADDGAHDGGVGGALSALRALQTVGLVGDVLAGLAGPPVEVGAVAFAALGLRDVQR